MAKPMMDHKKNNRKGALLPLIFLTVLLAGRLYPILADAAGAEDRHSLRGTIAQPEPDGVGLCAGQRPAAERDLKAALDILREIRLRPADEDTIIRKRGFTPQGLNCLFSKIMAGNDIFGWGSPAAYGVFLKPEELEAVRKYGRESLELREYLEEVLNIRLEAE
ncbi:MAG: hypothetical protein LBP33_03350 [Candidatus Adiutrix sp.]|jgi:hypothetical protein|nr:hypothetical protein [Candidatus Adiutrix sp.]